MLMVKRLYKRVSYHLRNNMDILLKAAKSWIEISEKYYIITYGLNGKLYEAKIMFEVSDFYHLAGFQYLTDLQLPAVPQSKILNAIITEKINDEFIKTSKKYLPYVISRLTALNNLENSLDNDFRVFRYRPCGYSFYTTIKAEYLIEGHAESDLLFFFTIKTKEYYSGVSIFMKDERDYTVNQKALTILKKEKVNIKTNDKIILLDKLSSQKAKE
jgi:hypothetical protein